MKAVKFTKQWNQYVEGDTAAFVPEEADMLVRDGFAEEVDYEGDPEYAPEVVGKPGGVKDLDAPHASQEEIDNSVAGANALNTTPDDEELDVVKDQMAPNNKAVNNAPRKK